MILGTISTVDADDGLTLIIDGEEEATTKMYHYLASYVPHADDRVAVEEIGDSYLIIGKVICASSQAGDVAYAERAGEADHATTADSAGTADKATGDESGNNIKDSYAADLYSSGGATIQLKNKNGVTIGSSVTVNNVSSASSATSATKATQDESGNNIKATYAADLTVSNGKIQLKNKNNGTIGTNATLEKVDSVYNQKQTSSPIYFGMLNNDLYFSTSKSYNWKKVTGTNA